MSCLVLSYPSKSCKITRIRDFVSWHFSIECQDKNNSQNNCYNQTLRAWFGYRNHISPFFNFFFCVVSFLWTTINFTKNRPVFGCFITFSFLICYRKFQVFECLKKTTKMERNRFNEALSQLGIEAGTKLSREDVYAIRIPSDDVTSRHHSHSQIHIWRDQLF